MKTLVRVVLLSLVLTQPVRALTFREASDHAFQVSPIPIARSWEFRFAQDSWKLTDDKVAHFGVGFMAGSVTSWALKADHGDEQFGVWMLLALGWSAWEIKDGLVRWEDYGAVGGDGFSWLDLAASLLGDTAGIWFYDHVRRDRDKRFID